MPQFGFRRFASRSHSRILRDRLPRTLSYAMTCFQEEPPLDTQTGMDTSGIRHELVDRVRREILAGTYDTPDKLEAAFGMMLDCLALD
jgi:hypothetical protein